MDLRIIEIIENEESKMLLEAFKLPIKGVIHYSLVANHDGKEWFYGHSIAECKTNYENLDNFKVAEIGYFKDSHILIKKVYPDLEKDKGYIDLLYWCLSEMDIVLNNQYLGLKLIDYIKCPRFYTFDSFQKAIFHLIFSNLQEFLKEKRI